MLNLKKILPSIRENISLASYTTFKIGGPARYFFIAKTRGDIIKALEAAQKCSLPFFILGGGSNILVSDEGFNGLVVKIQNINYKISDGRIIADAGVSIPVIAHKAIEAGFSGLEWAAGIPGTIGGAIRGNAGAFGGSMSDIVKTVEVLEIQNKNLRVKNLENKNCQFGYRDSVFKKKSNLIILSAVLNFKKGKNEEIERKTKEYLDYRKEKHPINYPSAGSVFKNYQLSISSRQSLFKNFPELKQFKEKGNIPAAYLISKCGLKGKESGGAIISFEHPNFIVNFSNAKAKDVRFLIKLIKQKVAEKFGIFLKEEIQYAGF